MSRLKKRNLKLFNLTVKLKRYAQDFPERSLSAKRDMPSFGENLVKQPLTYQKRRKG